jgi:hypothetical protein
LEADVRMVEVRPCISFVGTHLIVEEMSRLDTMVRMMNAQ